MPLRAGLNRYFAYGSNMRHAQMVERRCELRFVGIARVLDYSLVFTGRSKYGGGVADIVRSPGNATWGGLFDLTDEELLVLDRHERLYRRAPIVAVLSDGSTCEAITYIVEDKADPPLRPRREYLQKIIEGARQCGLPDHCIEVLRGIPVHGEP